LARGGGFTVKGKNVTKLDERNINSRKNNKRARKNQPKFHLLLSPNVTKLGNGRLLNQLASASNKKDYFLKSII